MALTFLEAIAAMHDGEHVAREIEVGNTNFMILHIGPKPGETYDVILARRNDQTPEEAAPWNAGSGTYVDSYLRAPNSTTTTATVSNGTEPPNIIDDQGWQVVALEPDGTMPNGPNGWNNLVLLMWDPVGGKVAAGGWPAGTYIIGGYDANHVYFHYYEAGALVRTYADYPPVAWNNLDGWHKVP